MARAVGTISMSGELTFDEPVGPLTVEQIVPGSATFVTAAASHGPARWRPSWAVMGPASLVEGRGPDGTYLDVPAPCAGSVWLAEVGRDGRLADLDRTACTRGDGHRGRCG